MIHIIVSFVLTVVLVILFKKYMKLKEDHYLLLSDYETLTNRNNRLRDYKYDLVDACCGLLDYVRSQQPTTLKVSGL